MKPKVTAKLHSIHPGDFRKTEATLMEELLKELKKDDIKLRDDHCILFVSGGLKILKFVFGFTNQEVFNRNGITKGMQTQVLDSRVCRITGYGYWNPLMLRNYAEAVGIELVGLKRFEEFCLEQYGISGPEKD